MKQAPLVMSREEAAYYLGMGDDLAEFDSVVGKEMPKPLWWIRGKPMWSRDEIDRAIDALPYAD